MWLSGGEVAFIVFAGLVAFGPKDIPRIARAAGRMSGQAMGFLFAARDRVHQMADKAELMQLHSEVKQTLAQLQAVRQEALHGVQILRPDPVPWASPAQSGAQPGSHPSAHPGSPPSTQAYPEGASQLGAHPSPLLPSRGWHMEPRSPAAFASSDQSRPVEGSLDTGVQGSRGRVGGGTSAGAEGASERGGAPARSSVVLPVSASSAGLLQKQQGAPTGSDMLREALLEEQVAQGAQQFLRRNGLVQRDHEMGA